MSQEVKVKKGKWLFTIKNQYYISVQIMISTIDVMNAIAPKSFSKFVYSSLCVGDYH